MTPSSRLAGSVRFRRPCSRQVKRIRPAPGVGTHQRRLGRHVTLTAHDLRSGPDTYGWAAHILDYFTTLQNPNDDYLPNFDPNVYSLRLVEPLDNGYCNGARNPLARPLPVLNSGIGVADAGNEDLATIDGLINVNTANIQTLYAVPWVPWAVVLGESAPPGSINERHVHGQRAQFPQPPHCPGDRELQIHLWPVQDTF